MSKGTTTLELDDAFWNDLLLRIGEGEVIPVVGPGAVTFGGANELLYPWLARKVPAQLDPELHFDEPPTDLQQIVDAQREKGQPVERIYRRLHRMVEDPELRPGATLAALADIEGFQLLISTTFDPLLSRAVESVSPGGQPEERRGATTLRGSCPDLPQELAKLERRFVYQILGRAAPVRDFVVWDDDVLHFLLRLDQQLPLLPRLSDALQKSHFLVLGLSFTDWLLRFFVQVIKRQRLSELAGSELYISERLEPTERDKVVIYFGRLTKQIRVVRTDPLDFISQLHNRWREKHPIAIGDLSLTKKAHREKHRSPGCIFVSYAGPDLTIARYVVSQLQSAGCFVWFNKEQIQPGEEWEQELTTAIEERCGLFLSLISDNSAARLQGYDIFERKLAARRRGLLADNAIFYLPMRIDAGEPLVPDNEPKGTKKIQGVRKLDGRLDAEFINYLREMQRENCIAFGYPVPSNT